MLLVDFLYHALTTLTASLPSFLSPTPESQDPKTTNAPPHISNTPQTQDTRETLQPHTYPELQKSLNQKSLAIETPLRTSYKRHDSMNSAKINNNVQVVQEVPSSREAGVLNSNTGFPEPFSPDRNTTLPHPEADTSKNATIEAGNLGLTRTHSRSRFLHHRNHSQNKSHGKIESADAAALQPPATNGSVVNPPAKNGIANGVAKSAEASEERTSPEKSEAELRMQKEGDEQGYSEGERKKGILRKLHLHKV